MNLLPARLSQHGLRSVLTLALLTLLPPANGASLAAAPTSPSLEDEATGDQKSDRKGRRGRKKDADAADAEGEDGAKKKFGAPQLAALKFREIGPAINSGRIVDLAVDPTSPKRYFAAAASGGVWKTTNAGTTWTPVFDGQTSYSIGALRLDPRDPMTLWVGTGENNSQRSVSYGDGVYRSGERAHGRRLPRVLQAPGTDDQTDDEGRLASHVEPAHQRLADEVLRLHEPVRNRDAESKNVAGPGGDPPSKVSTRESRDPPAERSVDVQPARQACLCIVRSRATHLA